MKSLEAVYDLLVSIGGAHEGTRFSFLHHHNDKQFPCTEWRFCGHLGHGGKYYREQNIVSCYREDGNTQRTQIIKALNSALDALPDL